MLTIEVETIDFDTQACVLRLKGRNVEENQYVKVLKKASYQTVYLAMHNTCFTLRWEHTTQLILNQTENFL